MLKIQKMSDIAPRTSSLEGSVAKMFGKTYRGDVPAHEVSSPCDKHVCKAGFCKYSAQKQRHSLTQAQ